MIFPVKKNESFMSKVRLMKYEYINVHVKIVNKSFWNNVLIQIDHLVKLSIIGVINHVIAYSSIVQIMLNNSLFNKGVLIFMIFTIKNEDPFQSSLS